MWFYETQSEKCSINFPATLSTGLCVIMIVENWLFKEKVAKLSNCSLARNKNLSLTTDILNGDISEICSGGCRGGGGGGGVMNLRTDRV